VFHSIRSFSIASAVLAAALSIQAPLGARTKSLAGDWTFTVERLPLPMVLAQKKEAVTGSLAYPHGAPIKLNGTFDGRTLKFSGNSSGENFTIHVDATGTLERDGTIDGSLLAHIVDFDDAHQVLREHNQEMAWTAQRTKVPSQGTPVHSAR